MKKLFPLILLLFAGCKKPDIIQSSEKSISAVVFKAVDNPDLTNDIAGIVSSDTIKFDFPQNIAVNRLIPSIDFKGQKINPANKLAQDFTRAITYTITAEDGTSKTYSFSITRVYSDTSSLILGT